MDLGIYYCDMAQKSRCYIEQAILELPLQVVPGGADKLALVHRFDLPMK